MRKAEPLKNLPMRMASLVNHLQAGKSIRVDKSVRPWTFHCGNFSTSGDGDMIGIRCSRHPIHNRTFNSTLYRGLLELINPESTDKRYYYKLKDQFRAGV